MIEKVGHIKNPLTVIAMFAGIAEVSGTVVLPFLKEPVQATFVWFLMGFPLVLVCSFFGTLLSKHHVLYAPSDFQNEDLFRDTFQPASSRARAKKFAEEIGVELDLVVGDVGESSDAPKKGAADGDVLSFAKEDNPNIVNESGSSFKKVTRDKLRRAIYARAVIADSFAVSKLAAEYGVPFIRDVAPKALPALSFDAIAEVGRRKIIVEVMYIGGPIERQSISSRLGHFQRYYTNMPGIGATDTEFVLAFVFPIFDDFKEAICQKIIDELSKSFTYKLSARFYVLPSDDIIPYVHEYGVRKPWLMTSTATGDMIGDIKKRLHDIPGVSLRVEVAERIDGSDWEISPDPKTSPDVISKLRRAVYEAFHGHASEFGW